MKRGRDTGFLYWIFARRQSAFFQQKKSRCEILAERVGFGTAENDSTIRRLAAKPVPHDQVNYRYMNGLSFIVVGAASNQAELLYVWDQATLAAKAIIVLLVIFSIIAWSTVFCKEISSSFLDADTNRSTLNRIGEQGI